MLSTSTQIEILENALDIIEKSNSFIDALIKLKAISSEDKHRYFTSYRYAPFGTDTYPVFRITQYDIEEGKGGSWELKWLINRYLSKITGELRH